MSETTKAVRVGMGFEPETEPPFIYSPYPEQIVQIREPDTHGQHEVVQLINEHWPVVINRLEELAGENELGNGSGYSGSFIRSVLRTHYVPEDMMKTGEVDEKSFPTETEAIEAIAEESQEIAPEEQPWHKIFRMGIRAALNNNIEEEEAFEAFGSGFVEGRKLKKEMDLEK